jgi:hypothetical protein
MRHGTRAARQARARPAAAAPRRARNQRICPRWLISSSATWNQAKWVFIAKETTPGRSQSVAKCEGGLAQLIVQR